MNSEIERLAKEAGWPEEAGPFECGSFSLEIFTALIAEDIAQTVLDMSYGEPLAWAAGREAAAAIRAKFALSGGEK